MSFVDLCEAISDYLIGIEVPLSRGKILIGWEFLAEQDAPPRIVIDPEGGPEPQAKGPSPTSQVLNGKPVYGSGTLIPPLFTDWQLVSVHCWGEDFRGALELRDAFIRGLQLGAPGCYRLQPWKWTKKAAYLVKGKELVLPVSIGVPITAIPYAAAPSDVRAVGGSEIVFSGGIGSTGCTST